MSRSTVFYQASQMLSLFIIPQNLCGKFYLKKNKKITIAGRLCFSYSLYGLKTNKNGKALHSASQSSLEDSIRARYTEFDSFHS